MRIIVIGGGVMGTTTAWYLAEEGHEVTLVDRAESLASECSFANGGILHASHAAPWNSPDIFAQMARWLGRPESPIALRACELPRMARWGFDFLRYSRTAIHRKNTRISTRLAVYSQQLFKELKDQTGIAYDDSRRGALKVYWKRRDMEQALEASRFVEDLGVPYHVLDPNGAIELEPSLGRTRIPLAGAIHYPEDQSGDARLFCLRLAECAAARGVVFRMGTSVTRLEQRAGRITALATTRGRLDADRYVLAAGVDTPLLGKPLGLNLPIRPVKGYSATLPLTGDRLTIPLIDDTHKIVLTRLGHRLRIAGIADFAGYDRRIDGRRGRIILDQALANFPEIAERVDRKSVEYWSCLRPMTTDGPPILGATAIANLFLNSGGGHMGWTFAAAAGRVVADIIGGRAPAIDLSGLTLDRYRG